MLEKGQFEIWQEQENNNWQVVQDGQMDLDEIPIVTATVGVPMHKYHAALNRSCLVESGALAIGK